MNNSIDWDSSGEIERYKNWRQGAVVARMEWGRKELKPVEYTIFEVPLSRWFWQRPKSEWYIQTEFSSLGPFATWDIAANSLLEIGIRPTRIICQKETVDPRMDEVCG